ncbi:hypothetical protein FKP32DRAFT_1596509 [Trametes sanguinea]|nr:hypothetical protein FKP32DRAFT_1596509 [Trametes sanguinea]
MNVRLVSLRHPQSLPPWLLFSITLWRLSSSPLDISRHRPSICTTDFMISKTDDIDQSLSAYPYHLDIRHCPLCLDWSLLIVAFSRLRCVLLPSHSHSLTLH